MADHHHVFPHPLGRLGPFVDDGRAVRQLQGSFSANAAACGEAHVRNDHVGPRPRHRHRFIGGKHIRRGQHVALMGFADHVDFKPIAHAGLFKVLAEHAIKQANRRKILHPGKAQRLQVIKQMIHDRKGIRAVHPRQHRRMPHDGQHLARHFLHNVIGIAIGQQPRQRAPPRHAVAPGIIDDDEVNPARLLAFGRKPRARPAADNGLALGNHAAEFFQQNLAFNPRHLSSHYRFELFDGLCRKGRIVDMGIDFNKLAIARRNPSLADGRKKCRIRFLVMKRLSHGINGRTRPSAAAETSPALSCD